MAEKRKRRRREPATAAKLPTPPPEPGISSCGSCTFQQLDRLHELVEQVLELRSKNARLFSRVRELERLKALRRLEENCSGLALPADEGELAFADSLLASLLENTPCNSFAASKSALSHQQQTNYRQRSRSISGTETQASAPLLRRAAAATNNCSCNNKRSSCHLPYESRQAVKRHSIAQAPCSPKVSKWTKVKAAFRWERAAAAFLEQENKFLLKPPPPSPPPPPLPTVAAAAAAAESPGSGPPSPGPAAAPLSSSTASSSPTSSTDELPRSSSAAAVPDRGRIVNNEIRPPVKTAWAMVKDMIQSRRERTNRGSIRSEDGYSLSSSLDSSADTLLHDSAETKLSQHHQQSPPSLTITLPSSEELRSSLLLSSPESNDYSGNSPTSQPPPPPPPLHCRQDSKWNKVKRAFLSNSSATSVPASPSGRISSGFYFDDGETGRRSYSASVEDLEKSVDSASSSYHQILNDKLSEWEKGSSKNGSSRTATSSPKDKDSANVLLMGEEQLTPEFKKKLQEWKRMKKTSSGTTSPEQQQLFRRRLTDWQIWRTATKTDGKTAQSATDYQDIGKAHLSEDFLRKMDEWKKIKSAAATRSDEDQSASDRGSSGCTTDSFSPNIQRRRGCLVDDKEFVPLDNIISMMEREQKFIEKQREKLLDKNSRPNEIDQIFDLTPDKREVLVRTSTGFYRFQGISQEFTRKLYEWEKSQGIAPEYSTFQLLNPAFRISSANRNEDSNRDKGSQIFKRSRSMSSVVENSQRDNNSTPIRQPSSLSLNDPTNLENDAKLRIDSKQTIGEEEITEDLLAGLDDSEPEAVIVDIEDVIEETASPMAKFQPQQTPVYCVTASETTSIAIPLGTVTASHEPSPVILIQAGDTHHRIRKHGISQIRDDEAELENSLKEHVLISRVTPAQVRVIQVDGDAASDENRKRLFEPSDIKICETIIEVEEASTSHIEEESSPDVEIRLVKPTAATTSFDEKIRTNGESLVVPESYEASTSSIVESACSSDKAKGSCSIEIEASSASGNEVVITVGSEIRQRKVLKTRRLTDSQVGYKWQEESSSHSVSEAHHQTSQTVISPFPETPSVERIIINESTLNKIVVPTASNEQIAQIAADSNSISKSAAGKSEKSTDSRSVFVKTKRIIFSPFSRRSKDVEQQLPAEEASPTATTTTTTTTTTIASTYNCSSSIQQSRSNIECSRPPLPQSPILCRKEYRGRSSPKETAPSIRMMIQRYNQKLQEDAGSPASSGSGSPIWRSPSSERRVRTQMERYQEEVRRAISPAHCRPAQPPLLEKSASTELLTAVQGCSRRRKSSLKNAEIFSNIKQSLVQEFKTLPIGCSKSEATPLRAQRIKKAKDEFLSRGPSCYSHDPSMDESCYSGSSLENLAGGGGASKSASAGMINVDPGTFERLRHHRQSRSCTAGAAVAAEFTGTLSKIASKFRRAKLKKVKDKEKESTKVLGTVSMLCRQSLLVDIVQQDEMSKSCPTSPSPSQRDAAVDEHSRFKQHRDSN